MPIRFVNTTDTIGDTGASDARVIFGDFDNDGDVDILYQPANNPGQNIGYRRNNGDGTFTDFANAAGPGTPFSGVDLTGVNTISNPLFVVDIDNDGDLDLVNRFSGSLSVLRNDNGQFTKIADPIGGTGTQNNRIILSDFDNDGDVDVLYQAGITAGQDIGYRRNNGNGTFTDFSDASAAGTPFAGVSFAGITVSNAALFVVDYDNDGDADIVNRTSNATSILRNDNGAFTLGTDTIGDTGSSDSRVLFADFDSDGDVDILYQRSSIAGQDIGFKRNNGDGTFTDFVDARSAGSPFEGADFTDIQVNSALFAIDYDSDGDVDLVSRISNLTRIIEQSSNTGDGSPPTLVGSTPSDNGTGVSPTANITLTFDESVVRGSGNVRIIRVSDGAVIETIAINGAQVTGSGTTWTINPNTTLVGGVTYALNIDRGGFRDSDGAIFAGLSGLTRLNFTVQAAVPPMVTTSGGAVSFVEGADAASSPIVIDQGVTLTDADSTGLASATVSISGGFQAGQDLLAFTANPAVHGNIAASYNAATGTLTLTSAGATATAAQFQAALRAVTYGNSSENPSTAARTISFVANDGTSSSAAATRTVTVTASNDSPVNTIPGAQNGTEDVAIVFSSTNRNAIAVADVDATTLSVTLTVGNGTLTLSGTAGLAFSVGDGTADATMTFTGSSAAINAALNGASYRGNLNYEGADTLTITTTDNGQSGSGGARNDVDTIAITLADDGRITGDAGPNALIGTPGTDFFDLRQGGDDNASGLGGNDGFYFGAAYTSADVVDGGEGTLDQIGLQGNYAGGVTLGSLLNTEMVVLLAGDDARFGGQTGTNLSYNIVADTNTIVSGNSLSIQANSLRSGENLTFNGSGSAIQFIVYAGAGTDNLTGGSGNDGFFFGQGRFNATDTVNGGAGTVDQLGLQGNFSGGNAITFGAGQLSGVEFIVLLSASDNRFGAGGGTVSYNLTMNDANVAATQTMIISATTLLGTEQMVFNGSAETNGQFKIFSGAGNDTIAGGRLPDEIWGGAGTDAITGNEGADMLRGGLGDDLFVYGATSHSTAAARDQILDFAAGDKIDLSALAANTGGGAFTYIGAGAPSGAGRQVQVVTTANGQTVNVYVDGDAVADLVIDVALLNGHTISAGDFNLGVPAPAQEFFGKLGIGDPTQSEEHMTLAGMKGIGPDLGDRAGEGWDASVFSLPALHELTPEIELGRILTADLAM